MMGVDELAAHYAQICNAIEKSADGFYQARLGETILRSAFQPIIEVTGESLRICGYEALIRPYRNGRRLSVETFFANAGAAEARLIDRLCRALHFRNFAAFGPKDTCLLVNVDPATYGGPDVAEMAATYSIRRLKESGLKPEQVIYEIVERPSTDERAIFALAAQLRASGARIAVDDFGGQALDFSRLAMLRPDIVKMDGGVLKEARAGGTHRKHLARLCQVVDRFGIDLLIEGIETADDLLTCRQLNPRYLQGYNFGRPVKRPLAVGHYAHRLNRAEALLTGGLDELAATTIV